MKINDNHQILTNKKNDPINLVSLIKELESCQNNCILWKVYKNATDQLQYIFNDDLANIVVKHTNLKVFGNASVNSIVAYGCHRLITSDAILIIPEFSLN